MKKSIASIAVVALTILAVGSIMMRSARADIVTFQAQLLASNEVPPVSNADSNAFGNVKVVLDTSTNTFRFDWGVNNIASPTIILSHIHEGPAGVSGPVRVDSGITPATPIAVVNGSASFSKSGISGPADVVQRLLANPSGFYFNIHSTLNPGGVVRGQLVVQQAVPGAGVPTLSEWGAILMGLLIVAVSVFFLVGRVRGSMMLSSGTPTATFEGPMKVADWRLLAKVTLYVEVAIALALVALSARLLDVAGALTSGLVLAFIVHLVIGGVRRR